ncbi:hypothetical protein K3495_g2256 [Podosphaera aphanis]|nr:hypothetical protein K3495_g2256 [Podosphaera aphanis]
MGPLYLRPVSVAPARGVGSARLQTAQAAAADGGQRPIPSSFVGEVLARTNPIVLPSIPTGIPAYRKPPSAHAFLPSSSRLHSVLHKYPELIPEDDPPHHVWITSI